MNEQKKRMGLGEPSVDDTVGKEEQAEVSSQKQGHDTEMNVGVKAKPK